MRLDNTQGIRARDIVNTYEEKEIARIFLENGEEPKAKIIARKICEERKKKHFTTTTQLSDLIDQFDKHPVVKARIFQALRIEVNKELENLETALIDSIELLEKK
jgi:16S rRNA (cytosine1402-N4)-methyltransferase